jgi:hypothetical protein
MTNGVPANYVRIRATQQEPRPQAGAGQVVVEVFDGEPRELSMPGSSRFRRRKARAVKGELARGDTRARRLAQLLEDEEVLAVLNLSNYSYDSDLEN